MQRRRRYNIFYWRVQDELDKSRRWFVATFDLTMRELVMSYLMDDEPTAYAIVHLEIEIHHPILAKARDPHYRPLDRIETAEVFVGSDEYTCMQLVAPGLRL